MKRFTRDETEHGKEYYLASDVDAAQKGQEPVETYIHEYTSQPHPNDFGIPKGHWWKAKQYADALAQPAYRAVKTVHEGKPVYVAQQDDDTQGFKPDWVNFEEGRKVGRAEAFEQIAEKVKKMPLENDTKDSFLIWLKEQNIGEKYMTQIVINADYGGFGLSDAATARYHKLAGKPYLYTFARDCPHLVQVVQELGSKANDEHSVLKVVEIPNGIDWEIEEYDGREWVSEKHETWR